MATEQQHHHHDLSITDRRLLSRAIKQLRCGVAPRIIVPKDISLSVRHLTDLADIANCAAELGLKPILGNISEEVSLRLEIAGLLPYFTTQDVSMPGGTLPAPAMGQPTRATWFIRTALCVAFIGMALNLAGCSSTKSPGLLAGNDLRIEPTADVPNSNSVPARYSNRCSSFEAGRGTDAAVLQQLQKPVFGPGDVVRIDIAEGQEFSGVFAVNYDGTVSLPFAGPVSAKGRTPTDVTEAVKAKLVSGGYFRKDQLDVSVLPLRWAPMNVNVSGAVYQSGRAVINDPSAEKRDPDALVTVGDAPMSRYIDAGLRAGSGIRPDADISRVKLLRGGRSYEVDLTGLVTGMGTPDIPLMAGDRLEVPSSGCFHAELMRPSQATPPGMRVFLSNLTVPAQGNSPSSVDSYATNLPYGSRLLQAAVSANCVGGAQASNASRTVVLISNNPITGRSEVIERSINDLIHKSNQDGVNPYMLPNDAMACYDSNVTNFREVARSMSEVLGPLGIVLGLI